MTAGGTSTLIRGARVFDGERLTQASNVLLTDGSITGIGDDLSAPPGAEVIEGRGRTLLPGLIDSHVHASDVRALGQALTFGVTTELDMFSDPDLAAQRRSLAARRDDVADIRTAVQGATAPGGPLARFAPDLPTVAGPQDAAAFVSAQVAQGADYLKVYLEDPAWYRSPALSADTIRALVAAAHWHGMLAIAHADSAAMAHTFIQAGGDALAHVLGELDLTRRSWRTCTASRLSWSPPCGPPRSCRPVMPARWRPTSVSWPAIRAWARSSTNRPGPSSPGRACWPTPAPAARKRHARAAGSTSTRHCGA
jgi:imidazolonepropionase-like amidohydrolase